MLNYDIVNSSVVYDIHLDRWSPDLDDEDLYNIGGRNRTVWLQVVPSTWVGGYFLHVDFLSLASDTLTETVKVVNIYDKDYPAYREDIALLGEGEVRGHHAQMKLFDILRETLFKTKDFQDMFPKFCRQFKIAGD